jgi:hypothetical protein
MADDANANIAEILRDSFIFLAEVERVQQKLQRTNGVQL